jgi:uncharacterized membrane protein
MFDFQSLAQMSGELLDGIGVLIILTGVILSTSYAIITALRHKHVHNLYRSYRSNLARSILIGLELLVAGDIIRSVAGDLNFDSVIILAIIVVVRSFLGIEFEMEIDGRWPWQRSAKKSD